MSDFCFRYTGQLLSQPKSNSGKNNEVESNTHSLPKSPPKRRKNNRRNLSPEN
jgi:hypothetical protein